MSPELVGVGGRLRTEPHHRRHRFAVARVGHPDDRGFGDGGVLVERGLDLGGVHVLAAADDDVLQAVDDVQVSVLVEPAHVAGSEPAVVGQRGRGRLGVVEVAAEHGRAPQPDLAGLAGRHRLAVRAGDPHLHDRRDGRAHAVGTAHVVGARVGDGGARRLGEAVAVGRRGAVSELIVDAAHELGRHQRRARRDAGQRLQRATLPAGLVQQLQHRRGHPGDGVDPLPVDEVERLAGVPPVEEHQLAAAHRVRQQERVEAAHVKQREGEQRDGADGRTGTGRGDATRGPRQCRVHRVHDVAAQVAVGSHRTLRPARRAGRVHDQRQVVRLGRDSGEIAARSSRQHVVEVDRAGGQVVGAGADHGIDGGASQLGCDPREALAVGDQHLRTGVGEAVGELGTGPPRVERHDHGADACRRPERQHPLGVVAHGDRHPVAGAHTDVVRQAAGQHVHHLVGAGVAEALVLVDEVGRVAVGGARLPDGAQRRRRVLEDPQPGAVDVGLDDLEHLTRTGHGRSRRGGAHGAPPALPACPVRASSTRTGRITRRPLPVATAPTLSQEPTPVSSTFAASRAAGRSVSLP